MIHNSNNNNNNKQTLAKHYWITGIFFFVVICFVFIHYIIIFIKIILFTNIYVKHACQLTFLFGINRHSLEKIIIIFFFVILLRTYSECNSIQPLIYFFLCQIPIMFYHWFLITLFFFVYYLGKTYQCQVNDKYPRFC